MDNLESTVVFNTQAEIPANVLGSGKNLDAIILENIKESYGGRTSTYGYIISDSMMILSRTLPELSGESLTGKMRCIVQVKATSIIVQKGHIINAKVIGKNKAGILLEKSPIRILLNRIQNPSDEDGINSLDIGDMVKCEIVDIRYRDGDKSIQCFGLFKARI